MILQDLLRLTQEECDKTKLRFCINNGIEDPKEVYKLNTEEVNTKWLLYRNKLSLFHKDEIAICMVQINKDQWLLTSIKKITNDLKVQDGISFEAEIIEKYRPFFGKTYISFHKTQQSGVIKWNAVCNELEVMKVDQYSYDDTTFESYKFELSFKQLENIINSNKKDWYNALSHIQAVYLITDKTNNNHYVGSASSKDEFLWSRWKTYVKTLHGGNVLLKKLIEDKGEDYIKENFTYRILDYFSENYPQSKIYESENYWKDVFKSRKFGYNDN